MGAMLCQHSTLCPPRTPLSPGLPGSSWAEVETPGKEVEALHVAVGVSVVWVVTKDFKVHGHGGSYCEGARASNMKVYRLLT